MGFAYSSAPLVWPQLSCWSNSLVTGILWRIISSLWFLLHEFFNFTIPSKSQVPSDLGTQLGTEKDPAPRPAGLALNKTAKLLVASETWPHTSPALSPLRSLLQLQKLCLSLADQFEMILGSRPWNYYRDISSGYKVRCVLPRGQVRTLCSS